MAMLLDLPKLPRCVVEHISTFVYGPQIAAFIANYGERIPARVIFPLDDNGMLYIRAESQFADALNWSDGLRRRYKRYLWRLPKRAFRYLARGMPVLLDLGAQWSSPYTVIAVRRASLIVGTSTCEIEIPKAVIRKIVLYADVFTERTMDPEPVFVDRTLDFELHSMIGCDQHDAVEHARGEYAIDHCSYLNYILGLDGIDFYY